MPLAEREPADTRDVRAPPPSCWSLGAHPLWRAGISTPGYEGVPDSIWKFTTSDLVTPLIALEGKLQATLEPGVDPKVDCSHTNDCSGGCVEKGARNVTRARVTLPLAEWIPFDDSGLPTREVLISPRSPAAQP